jgi:hypothetical protein
MDIESGSASQYRPANEPLQPTSRLPFGTPQYAGISAESPAGFPGSPGEHAERANSPVRLPGSIETTDRAKR